MTLPAEYSLPRSSDLARFIAETYELGEITDCYLLSRSINDSYALHTRDGARFVVRLGNRRARGEANLDYETAVLAHLDRCGVPVAASVSTRDGRPWALVPLPEGARTVALFRFLPGRFARRDGTLDARAQGRTLAEVHRAGRSYDGPASRFRLDSQHLIQRPLAAVLDLPTVEPESRDFLVALAARLDERLAAEQDALAWGHCHGDCHGLNAKITDKGAFGPSAAFFDFDDAGPGWLAYDLAVYLWNKALSPGTLNLWPPFLEGYKSVLPLAARDLDATLLFVPIRHIWLLGKYAQRADEWGLDHLSSAWLDRQVGFLRGWEEDHLTARLF